MDINSSFSLVRRFINDPRHFNNPNFTNIPDYDFIVDYFKCFDILFQKMGMQGAYDGLDGGPVSIILENLVNICSAPFIQTVNGSNSLNYLYENSFESVEMLCKKYNASIVHPISKCRGFVFKQPTNSKRSRDSDSDEDPPNCKLQAVKPNCEFIELDNNAICMSEPDQSDSSNINIDCINVNSNSNTNDSALNAHAITSNSITYSNVSHVCASENSDNLTLNASTNVDILNDIVENARNNLYNQCLPSGTLNESSLPPPLRLCLSSWIRDGYHVKRT